MVFEFSQAVADLSERPLEVVEMLIEKLSSYENEVKPKIILLWQNVQNVEVQI